MSSKGITRKGFIYSCALGAIGVLGLSGCSVSIETKQEQKNEKSNSNAFSLLGTFLVEPTDELTQLGVDFSAIPDTRKLLICLFDITNSTKQNWDARPQCSISYDSGNQYEIDGYSLPTQVQTFIAYSGYLLASNNLVIDAGGAVQRAIAPFLVNTTDLEEKGTLKIDIPGCASTEIGIEPDAIESVAIPDAIFKVEENPDGYQLAHSVSARANLAYTLTDTAAQSSRAGDNASAAAGLVAASALFSQDTVWGVSLMSGQSIMDSTLISTELCPKMDFSKIASIDQQLASDVEQIGQYLTAMVSAFDNQDYSTLNTNKNSLSSLLAKYVASASI